MIDRFVQAPARGEIFVAQGGAQAEPWVRGPVKILSLSPCAGRGLG